MARRNELKVDVEESFYHVYARGVARQSIYHSAADYAIFLNLFKRYLSADPTKDSSGRPYPHLRGKVELLCYCLMPNHFHLLLYQKEESAMQQLMRGLMGSYGRSFNRVHQRSGPLFESRYKASLITSDQYLEHISRYIHLNPHNWQDYPYSSLSAYKGIYSAEWLQPERILKLFTNKNEYLEFVQDYEANKRMLDSLKYELADM